MPVPMLYRGPFRVGLFKGVASSLDNTRQRGLVARVAVAFGETQMAVSMAKYVRAGHVQSETHRMKAQLASP